MKSNCYVKGNINLRMKIIWALKDITSPIGPKKKWVLKVISLVEVHKNATKYHLNQEHEEHEHLIKEGKNER